MITVTTKNDNRMFLVWRIALVLGLVALVVGIAVPILVEKFKNLL